MNYNKEDIEKRIYRTKLIREIIKKFLYIILIVTLYNTFLITKSALDNAASKEMFGYKAYIITTESMTPSIKVGDAIIVEKCGEEKLKVGDIVTLQNAEEITITHRITEIKQNKETGQNEYITKGDNNNVQDSETVDYKQIEGKKVLVIPLLGKILLALKNKMYLIILILVLGLIFLHAVNLQRKKKMRREKKKNEERKAKKEQNIEKTS